MLFDHACHNFQISNLVDPTRIQVIQDHFNRVVPRTVSAWTMHDGHLKSHMRSVLPPVLYFVQAKCCISGLDQIKLPLLLSSVDTIIGPNYPNLCLCLSRSPTISATSFVSLAARQMGLQQAECPSQLSWAQQILLQIATMSLLFWAIIASNLLPVHDHVSLQDQACIHFVMHVKHTNALMLFSQSSWMTFVYLSASLVQKVAKGTANRDNTNI